MGAFWIAKVEKFLYADKEYSNQTAQMRRLILVFIGWTCPKVHGTFSHDAARIIKCMFFFLFYEHTPVQIC